MERRDNKCNWNPSGKSKTVYSKRATHYKQRLGLIWLQNPFTCSWMWYYLTLHHLKTENYPKVPCPSYFFSNTLKYGMAICQYWQDMLNNTTNHPLELLYQEVATPQCRAPGTISCTNLTIQSYPSGASQLGNFKRQTSSHNTVVCKHNELNMATAIFNCTSEIQGRHRPPKLLHKSNILIWGYKPRFTCEGIFFTTYSRIINDLHFVNTNHKKIFLQKLNNLDYRSELVISGKPQ